MGDWVYYILVVIVEGEGAVLVGVNLRRPIVTNRDFVRGGPRKKYLRGPGPSSFGRQLAKLL